MFRKRHVSVFDVFLVLLGSFLLMVLIWQDFDPRFLLFFALGLVWSESWVLWRWRLSMPCKKCGFDPLIYKRNPARAAEKVKAFIARRATDPFAALKPMPRLPVITKKASADRRRELG